MPGEPVPTWAKVAAVAVGALTVLLAVPAVLLTAGSLASTVAAVKRTTTFSVGPGPRLQVNEQFGAVVIEAAQDGRIVVHDQRTASSISRAGAAATLQQMAVDASQRGDLVVVSQASPAIEPPSTLRRESTLTIEVPAHTDLDVSNVGNVDVRGVDGVVHLHGPGSLNLAGVTLRGTSTVEAPTGEIKMTDVTVAGSATVSMTVGGIRFDGQLAPGGAALDVENGAGDVSVVLPHPTDARAVVSSGTGDFHPDGAWLFTPDSIATPRRWTADLGPSPTGTVTVSTRLGGITFGAR